jgi:putative ABC transport system permease protein
MSFWKIAWRNIEQRALASSLTALSMALGVAVMIAVIVIYGVAVRQFDRNAQGYHVIVGGKGGELQLVMSTVYHVGQPLYPIPYSYYQKFLPGGEFADVTEVAVPVCLGDSYVAPDGTLYRVVGTTPDMFDKLHYDRQRDGTPISYQFQPGGRNLRDASNLRGKEFREAAFEAVIGSVVATRAGLKLGDEINPTHGISSEGHQHEGFRIVGILEPTGTANDRAVFINIEGFYLLEGHASAPHDEAHDGENEYEKVETPPTESGGEGSHAEEHNHVEPLPIEQREVTSILVLCNSELAPRILEAVINRGDDPVAQVVAPRLTISRLMNQIVDPMRVVLLVLTILIVIVAGISILVSIYNSMSERSHDIAVMRALGASRQAVMGIILVESILLAVGGGLIGIALGHGIIGLASTYVVERTGISLGMLEFHWQELVLIPALVVLASLVGLLPAVAAYRTDVAKALSGSR